MSSSRATSNSKMATIVALLTTMTMLGPSPSSSSSRFGLGLGGITVVEAHGYVRSPRSRNLVASEDTVWYPQTSNDPEPETCPHCLNRGGTLARCGVIEGRDYDAPRNALGGPMPQPNVQAEYVVGQEVTIDVLLTAHHKGHFTFKACPINPYEVPSQSCFDDNPLIFVQDMLYGANAHPAYPERAYLAPVNHPDAELTLDDNGYAGMAFSHRFRLPSGVTGDLVLIQWHYVTANSCRHSGYDSYNWPPGWDPGSVGPCGQLPPDGAGVPEQFWNCAEVRILPSSSPPPPPPPNNAPPTPPPTKFPTKRPTKAPVTVGQPSGSPPQPQPTPPPQQQPNPPTPGPSFAPNASPNTGSPPVSTLQPVRTLAPTASTTTANVDSLSILEADAQQSSHAVAAHLNANWLRLHNYISRLRRSQDSSSAADNDPYPFDGFVEGLRFMHEEGVGGQRFYMGDDESPNGPLYGLVNLAAFLSQSLEETIGRGSCDERNKDRVNGRYPLSNSCGQFGESYQDDHCPADEAHMECPVDPNMQIAAEVIDADGGVGPFHCGPATETQPYTGYWEEDSGEAQNAFPFSNRRGRVNVEGCCWWGRGALPIRGVCNYGKLNYHLGKRARDEGRPARYPSTDFCASPDAVCSCEEYPDLKWVVGLFRWVSSVQKYNRDGWNYMSKLRDFVDGGMSDMSFIDAVSGIVNGECHDPPCFVVASSGSYSYFIARDVESGSERKEHFQRILAAFDIRTIG